MFFGSLSVFCIAVVGEYIAKIFEEVKRRPLYVRRSIIRDGEIRAAIDELPKRRMTNASGIERGEVPSAPAELVGWLALKLPGNAARELAAAASFGSREHMEIMLCRTRAAVPRPASTHRFIATSRAGPKDDGQTFSTSAAVRSRIGISWPTIALTAASTPPQPPVVSDTRSPTRPISRARRGPLPMRASIAFCALKPWNTSSIRPNSCKKRFAAFAAADT